MIRRFFVGFVFLLVLVGFVGADCDSFCSVGDVLGGLRKALYVHEGFKLVAYWEGEGNAEDSFGGNDGTIYGASFADGKVGQAFSFEDDYAYVDMGNSFPLNGNFTDFSLEFWMFADSSSGDDAGLVGKGTIVYGTTYKNGNIYFYVNSDTNSINAAVGGGAWHHIVATLNSTDAFMRLYVDGSLAASKLSDYNFTGTDGTFYLGRAFSQASYFDGLLDEVAVFEKVLSAEQVSEQYFSGLSQASLVSFWKADMDNGTDFFGGNDLVINGSGPWNGSIFGSGRFGQAFSFDGVDDNLYLDGFDDLDGVGSFALEFWVKPAELPFVGSQGVFVSGSSSQKVPWVFGSDGNSNLVMEFETTTGGVDDCNIVTSNLVEGVWNHVVFLWDGSVCTSYVDGVQGGSDGTSGGVLADSDGFAYLGFADAFFNGSLDEVAIWNRTLTGEEVLEHNGSGVADPNGFSLDALSMDELKGLINIYLSTNASHGMVNCTGYLDEIDAASSLGYAIPRCSDFTEYGLCSVSKPSHCYADGLSSRCVLCGCPKGQWCNVSAGDWGECQTGVNVSCVVDSDCKASSFEGGYFCQGDNKVYRNFTRYSCLNPGEFNSSCVAETTVQVVNVCCKKGTECKEGCSECENIEFIPVFRVKDDWGKTVAAFDSDGSFALIGNCSVGVCDDISSALFVVKSVGGEVVAYIDDNGDLCLESGDCFDQSANCNAPDGSFVIKDGSDVDVAYIDSSGGLCLTGFLLEEWAFEGNPFCSSSDDINCGVINCSGWYVQEGEESVLGVEFCYAKQDITSDRCEGVGDCKDPNSEDCDAQLNAEAVYVCGRCQYIDNSTSCVGNVLGGCGYYDAGTSTGLCSECDGAGNEVAMGDDSSCGVVDCSGWFVQNGTENGTETEECWNKVGIISDRCDGLGGGCKDANSSDCIAEESFEFQFSCGVCQYINDSSCVGTELGSCAYYGNESSCGACKTCDNVTGDCVNTPADDLECGVVDCSGWYVQSGTESAQDTESCYNKVDLTSSRCEGFGDCKDSNSEDCDETGDEGVDELKYSCGICRYISSSSCTGTTLGSCSKYTNGETCGYSEPCQGDMICTAGGDCDHPCYCPDGAGSDDPDCGTIDCSGWYVQTGTQSSTTTEYCFAKQDITAGRCEGVEDCKDPNTADCNGQPNEATAKYSCGTCKYIADNHCTGTTLGSCTNYPSGTSCGTDKECNGNGVCVTWVDRTGPAYWEPYGGYIDWDGNSWAIEDIGVLRVVGNWWYGYRPTKVKITHGYLGGDYPMWTQICDFYRDLCDDHPLLETDLYSNEVATLNWEVSYDIGQIQFNSACVDYPEWCPLAHIYHIKFCEGC